MRWWVCVLAGFFLVLVAGCPCPPGPHPVEPSGTDDCTAACAKMQELGCEEGTDLDDGTTCVEFCVDTQQSGHALNPTCLKDISSCEDIETVCGQ